MNKKIIVVAEDTEIIRDALVAKLKTNFPDVEIVEFKDGAELARYLRDKNNQVDYIVSDNQMPIMNGMDVFKEVFRNDSFVHRKETPCIMFTAIPEDIVKREDIGDVLKHIIVVDKMHMDVVVNAIRQELYPD